MDISNETNFLNENNNENVSECLHQLFDYYQTVYEPNNENHHTIAAFKSKLLSGPLRRIAEIEIDEELQPNCNSFWSTFHETFVIPEVYINNQRVYALVDTGASKSVMSLKFSQTEKMESLQLVFKCNCLRKSPEKKIDFFRSTSHVDFLKAHIKISYLPNFQNFWTLPH